MTRTQISELRRQFIEERKTILGKKVSALENKIYDRIFDKLIANLEKENGRIISNKANINLTTALDKLFTDIYKNEYLTVVKSFSKDLSGILELNKTYFSIIENDQEKLNKAAKQVDSIMRKRIGLDSSGDLVKKGFLDSFIKDNTLEKKVKESVLKSVTSQKPFSEFRDEIKKIIVGDDNTNGGLMKHFNTFAFDTYTQFDRTAAKQYAVKLELKAFIYSGGVVENTREFCKARNGKVFTTDEAEEWKNKNFEGKPANYDPLLDAGGYNCRHHIDYISDSLAISRRPDLEKILK